MEQKLAIPAIRAARRPARFPANLSRVSTARLCVLSDSLYAKLDTDHPSRDTRLRYYAVMDELESRGVPWSEAPRATVCDNPAASQFDIYEDGTPAGAESYRLQRSEIWLMNTSINPGFEGRGLMPILIDGSLRNAHRRRLAVLPFCPAVRHYLSSHSEFLRLVPTEQRARFSLPLRQA